jgi:hypothetical protein
MEQRSRPKSLKDEASTPNACEKAKRPSASQLPTQRPAAAEESGSCSDEGSDESESESEDDDWIDELLQKDDDVFKVEKLLEWRWRSGGVREFLVKWEGFSNEDTTWEPEENILETGMIKKVTKKRAARGGAKPPKQAPRQREPERAEAAAPAPEPTRARSSRAGAQAASEAARRAAERDAAASEASAEESEPEEVAPSPPRAVRTAPGKKQKAAAPKGQAKRAKPAAKKPAGKRAKLDSDSSDDEDDLPLDQRKPRAGWAASSAGLQDSSDEEL